MSAVVEDLIVAMGFDNKQFEAAVKISMATIGQLKQGLNFPGAGKGIQDAQAAVNSFSGAPMISGVDAISAKFLAMSTIGITAVSNLTNKIIDAGTNMAKALTIDPVSSGLEEYELNMNSIQTILSNTASAGTNLDDVNRSLDTLNTYADETKYSFADMAKNIGTFTAAGVDLDTATSSIKGIANIAAISGSNSEQASTAMYQLSQAISAGKVGLQDWNSVVTAGMGGSVFQRALAQTATQMGTLSEGALTLEGDMQNVSISGKSFRESIMAGPGTESWLTSDVLTETLKQFTGDLTDAELAAEGFNEEQIRAIQNQAVMAKDAAQEAKTFSDMYGALKEGVGSGWATTFRTVIGDFEEAKTMWTGVSRELGDIFGASADARNELLGSWKAMGGRDILLEGLTNAWHALESVVAPIKEAFRSIFPPQTAEGLLSLTQAFTNFTSKLIVGSETADKLKRTFAGVFAIFGIVWEVVKGLFGVFGDLFGAVSGGSGGFLELTAVIGDWVVKVHNAIKGGEIFKNIFAVLGTVLKAPIALLSNFGQALGEILGSVGSATSAVKQFVDILFKGDYTGGPLAEDSKIVDILFRMREGFQTAASVIEQFWNILSKGEFVGGFFEEDSPIVEWLFNIRDSIEKFFSSSGLKMILGGAAGVGLGFAVKAMLKKAFNFGGDEDGIFTKLKDMFGSIGDMADGFGDLINGVTDSFKAMQQNLQAGTLLKIGAAIGIVALALKLMSTIDGADMARSLGGVAVAMALLMTGMTIMTKIAGSGGMVAMPAVAIGLMGLAAAILILTAAVKVLATMSWAELTKGLGALAVIMAVVVAAAYGLSKAEGQLIRAGIAMIPLALAIRILVGAVQQLSQLSWTELAKGVGSIAILITSLGLALKLMPKNMVSIGVGLLAISAGMLLMTMSIEKLGGMDIKTLGQGIVGVSIAITGIALAMKLMPKNMPMLAVGLLLVAAAMTGISAVILSLGSMSPENMAQGLIGLAAALAMMALSLNLMSGTLTGSAALAVAAVGLALLLPSILALSMLSWEQLLIGMAGLAGTLTILGVAGLVLGPVVPVLVALGVAMGLMGIGFLAVGAGALVFSSALTAIIGVAALGQIALVNLMAIIPQMAAAFGSAVIAFVTTIANSATQLAAAVKTLVIAMLDAFIEIIPKIKDVVLKLLESLVEIIVTGAPKLAEAFTAIITAFLTVLTDNVPRIIETVFSLMMSFLQTIRDRIPDVVTVVTDIIVAFINALADNLPRIVQAGFDFIISFMNSLAESIRSNLPLVGDAAGNIASAIIDGVIQGIKNGVERVFQSMRDMASGAIDAALGVFEIRSPSRVFTRMGGHITDGLVIGVNKGKNDVANAGRDLAQGLLGTVNKELGKLGGTAKTVWDILAFGDYANNGGILDEDSPIVDMLFNVREGLTGIAGAANEAWGILTRGDFTGVGPWEEDDKTVDMLFNIREGLFDIGGAAKQTWDILARGNFVGGPWAEDSAMVDTLFDVREGMQDVGGAAKQAWDILNSGDFKGGPWDEDSPIVNTLFDIREGFEGFNSVGEDAIAGILNGLNEGAGSIAQAAHNMAIGALDAARDALGIQSPSKEFEQIGVYSIDGLLMGFRDGTDKVNGQGKTVANALMNGFSKGLGTEMPKAFASIFETLRTGTADVKFWGPNSPLTEQFVGLNAALMEAEIRLAAFYGEVDMADPASIQAYVEKTGGSIKYLAGLLNGVEKAADSAFEMLASGKGLDVVLGDEKILNNLLDGVLSMIPGIEVMLVRLGLAVVDGFLGMFFGTSVMGLVGKFITWAVRQIGGIFGIEFPVEEEVDEATKKLEDFLVNVEDTQGRFEKLTDSGIKALTNTLTEANEAVDAIDTEPVITPVLDLTEYNKAMGGMDTPPPTGVVVPESSSNQASTIYTNRQALDASDAAAEANKSNISSLEFKQYNNSPLPLSHVDIYKDTKGILNMAKEALGIK